MNLIPLLIPLSIFSLMSSRCEASEDSSAHIVRVDAKYIFVPVGFDDNDNAQAVIDGYLPNGCYRLAKPLIKINYERHEISVTPRANYFDDRPCVEALIPYQLELQIGQLPAGEYRLTASGQDRTSVLNENLFIKHATSQLPDDEIYAPVDQVSVNTANDGSLVATIDGRLTNSCLEWKGIKIQHNSKTINILPMMTMTRASSEPCRSIETPYHQVIPLPKAMQAGRYLLHVRSLNGQAFNQLFFVNPVLSP